jgi:hypothetical protein
MVIEGQLNEPLSWRLNGRFALLRDVHRAQDFIASLMDSFVRRAESGELLRDYQGDGTDVLAYLAAMRFVGDRAKSFIARESKHGVKQMPGNDRAPGFSPIELMDDANELGVSTTSKNHAGETVGTPPLEIDWDPSTGINARIRMAVLQCWERLAASQLGLSMLEADLQSKVQPDGAEDPMAHLARRHREGRASISEKLRELQITIEQTAGMGLKRRELLSRQQTLLHADQLIQPLRAAAVQALLNIDSQSAAHQQISRYRRSMGDLFPSLRKQLTDAVGSSS